MNTINQSGENDKPKPGVPCIESRQLATALRDAQKETFTYAELSAVIGSDVRGIARGYLLTAREIVLRESGMVFRPVRNIGLRRLGAAEVAMLDDRFTHVRRTHQKTLRELGTVDLAAVRDDARISCAAKMALAHMTVHTHHGKQMKQLEGVVGGRQINLTETLNAFKAELK